MIGIRYYRFGLAALALLILSLSAPVPAGAGHLTTTFIPIPGLPTEDVDMVEMSPPGVGLPPTIIYPTESGVNYIDMFLDVVYASVPKPGPNISGVDYVVSPDGAIGVMPTLGVLNVFTHGPGLPALLMTLPLPGTPARRDIDAIIVPGLINPWDAIYATGTEVHRIDLTTGVILWTTGTPTPIVEAVDPLYVAVTGFGFPVLFVATDGFMTEIDATTGAIVNPGGLPTPIGTTVIREVDARLNPAGTLVFLHANFVLDAFSTATGALVSSVPLASMGIEGNDIEWDGTGTRGAAITVASMVWFDAGTGAVTDVIPFVSPTTFLAYGHQRNQDVIFTAPFVLPQHAGYLAQGAFFTYDVPPLPIPIALLAVTPTPSTTQDGVDPVTTDASPFPAFPPGPVGVIALAPTQGFANLVDLGTGAMISIAISPTVLRVDVDARRGATAGNKNYQPSLGGVLAISGFPPDQYTVTVSTGVHVIDVSAAAWLEYIPTGMIYRGGDQQVTTLLGPMAPPYTTDEPDQDFLTKCWEYKYAMNRWPMWYATSNPLWYPHFMPYGIFGPPALMGWDIWNDWKVMVLNNQTVALLDREGVLRQTIPLPALPIGGLIWDWDNKICKLRLRGQQEAIINLSTVYATGLATVTYVPYTLKTEWYPIVDRMNGWEFVVARGARRIWVYDHVAVGFVTWIDLPARIMRPPVFDEQRKTLCAPLANRQVFFFDSHAFRTTGSLLAASTYTVPLPAHVVADPVFDIYNHHTLLRLRGGSVSVIDNTNAFVLYNTPPLPYWPIGPIQIDCYNKVAKWNAYDGLNYFEHWLNLYPLATGGVPDPRTVAIGLVRPYGYPQFDSRDGWEFTRIGNTIRRDYLYSPYPFASYVSPFALAGSLFLDRVNKYGLVATTGTRVLWMNLFRLTQGLPGATIFINLPSPPTQGIHFLTQLHLGVVQMQNGQIAFINMKTGTLVSIPVAPQCIRQIYVHPFSGLVNYPALVAGVGYDVTLDANPLRQQVPGPVTVRSEPLPAPTNEAANFIPPPPVNTALVTPMGFQAGDDGSPELRHFRVHPAGGTPGDNYQVDNGSTRDTPNQMDPVSGTFEDDGSSEFAVLANTGELVCIRVYDPEGNASSEVCIPAPVVTGVGGQAPERFSFALGSANPVADQARFRFALANRCRVDLAIYDMGGRRVASLLSRDMEPGEYGEVWRLSTGAGAGVPAGVYFARFRAGAFEESRRLVVVR